VKDCYWLLGYWCIGYKVTGFKATEAPLPNCLYISKTAVLARMLQDDKK
jgi:hypothetical protein